MGKSIDKLKCGGRTKSHKGGGKVKSYPDGGKVKSDTTKYDFVRKASPASAAITENALARQQRLRGYQGTLTKAFSERFPDVPVSDMLKELNARDPQLSRRDVPQIGEDFISKYGDLSIQPEEIPGILGEEGAAEYFQDTKTGRTKGTGDEKALQRFGFRNMIYPQFRSKNTGLYNFLDAPTETTQNFQGGGTTGGISKEHALQVLFGDKFQDGQIPEEIKSGLLSGDATGFSGDAAGSAISTGADLAQEVVGGVQNKIKSGYDDYRVDPAATMKKSDQVGVAGDVLKSTAKGAASGAIFGPVGAIVGGGIGLISSGAKAILGKGEREEARDEASQKWGAHWTNKYFANKESYVKGGLVTGKGGPKSDSISMKAKDGSFIVPAENAKTAMDLGQEFLGWTPDTYAKRNNGGSGIKISDGEVLFTPEEADKLSFHGVDLNGLAPNAGPGKKFEDGGWKFDKEKGWVVSKDGKTAYDNKGNEYRPDTSGEMAIANENTVWGSDIFNKNAPKAAAEKEEGSATFGSVVGKAAEYIPELASIAQIAGATKGLVEAGKKPDLVISGRLKALARDTAEAATHGLSPDVKNSYLRSIERTRRDVMNKIVSRGGSPGEVRESIRQLTSQTLEQKSQIPIMEEELKLKKKGMNIGVENTLAGMEFAKSKIDSDLWHEYQGQWGTMLSTGIGNLIGARQYKSHVDFLKATGSASPSFNITTKS